MKCLGEKNFPLIEGDGCLAYEDIASFMNLKKNINIFDEILADHVLNEFWWNSLDI